jgi:hypothetical protein
MRTGHQHQQQRQNHHHEQQQQQQQEEEEQQQKHGVPSLLSQVTPSLWSVQQVSDWLASIDKSLVTYKEGFVGGCYIHIVDFYHLLFLFLLLTL